jgi:SAM-dependent methyltransferase
MWESNAKDICPLRSLVVESASFAYVSTELHALAEAKNYYRWVIRQFAPFIGKRVIEVGAGIGTFAGSLLNHVAVSELVLVEPSDNLLPLLQRRFAEDPRVKIVPGYFQPIAIPAGPAGIDSIVLVNVLEHMAEDQAFLEDAHAALIPGGTLLLLVPALPWIFGRLDQAFGHYRRYTKTALANKLHVAGFDIIRLAYVNLLGIAGWFLTGRVLGRTTLKSGYVRWYDRWVIPWLSRLEGRWEPPCGQSLIVIARKCDPAEGASPQDRKRPPAGEQTHPVPRRR